MTTVHITTGLPASGKTTHARTLDALRFSLDDYRAMMGIGTETWTNEREQVAIGCLVESARSAIRAGNDIVIDNTHLVPRLPKMFRKEFSRLGVTFQVHDFTNVTIDECIERDAVRDAGHVGEDVIRKLAARHADATKGGWRLTDEWMNLAEYVQPKPYDGTPGGWPSVICDIDGTVAIHGDERGHYEYEKVSSDQPNPAVIEAVIALSEKYKIVFVSGREDRARDDTLDWLFKHGIRDGAILMRKTGDHRPDYIVKQEIFDGHIRDKYDVKFVLDDRDQVVQMWREMGLPCFQVADGNF